MEGVARGWRVLLPVVVLASLAVGLIGFAGESGLPGAALVLVAAACALIGAHRRGVVVVHRPVPVVARGFVAPPKPLANRANRPGLVRPRAPGC